MRQLLLLGLALIVTIAVHAASVTERRDPGTGWVIYTVTSGDMAVEMSPAAGCNVLSIRYQKAEFLRQAENLIEVLDGEYGIPILYPTPGVVRDKTFNIGGQNYSFRPNEGSNFVGGLVRSVRWERPQIRAQGNEATLSFELPFKAGTALYRLFSVEHTLRLTITVLPDRIRWRYEVDNLSGYRSVPFGLAIRPVLNYEGSRKDTYVVIPAESRMQMQNQLPTGQLLPVVSTKYDLRTPVSLADFVVDDIYVGYRPTAPAAIDFRGKRVGVWLRASPEFTHLSLDTPRAQNHFAVEYATSSSDAYQLYTQGFTAESSLIIVPPGGTSQGWVEMQFQAY